MIIYKIDKERKLENLRPIFWGILLIFIFVIGLFFTTKITFISAVVYLLLFMLSSIIPMLALYANYYYTNKDDVFIYHNENSSFSFSHKGKVIDFTLKDIKKIYYHKSFILNPKRPSVFPWNDYNYTVIVLHSGVRIILTCLLVGRKFDMPLYYGDDMVCLGIYRWVLRESLYIPK